MPVIHCLANDGSPLGVHYSDIHGENGRAGVGGAELYILTLLKYWTDLGWDVTFYNDPKRDDGHIKQKPLSAFNPKDNRDILLTFRSPNKRVYGAKGYRVWLSCDQYTVGNYADYSLSQQKIVTISPFHSNYFETRYGITDTVSIDIPVRLEEYTNPVDKDPTQFMYCSVPDRGLDKLAMAWGVVAQELPEARLVITSSWGLWDGGNYNPHLMRYKMLFAKYKNVEFLGAVPRSELIKLQQSSSIMSYPCDYEELFCISAAEMQVAGAYPVTTNFGALATTNMGIRLGGLPTDNGWTGLFGTTLVKTITDPNLPNLQKEVQQKAIERFDIKTIHNKWEEIFNEA